MADAWTSALRADDERRWPPPGEPFVARGLPEPATVVYRLAPWRGLLLASLPAFLLLAYARAVGNGVPASRLLNPGVLTAGLLAVLALAAAVLPPRQRVMVVGGPTWVGCRRFTGLPWRVVDLAAVAEYSYRSYATRGGRMVAVTMRGTDGTRTAVAAPAGEPFLGDLVAGLAAHGAREVDPRRLPALNRRRVAGLSVVILLVALLPIVYLDHGPMQLLPGGLAGAFTSSGCRAALTAEKSSGAGSTPVAWDSQEQVDGQTWRFAGEVAMTVAEYAGHTADPAARLARLTADGATGAMQVTYAGPTGARIAVDTLQFSTAAGAQAYLHYVNRATCERFGGSAGPAPGEVRWTSGRTYGIDRWAAGSTIYDVSPVLGEPRATRTDVDALAAAGQGGTRTSAG